MVLTWTQLYGCAAPLGAERSAEVHAVRNALPPQAFTLPGLQGRILFLSLCFPCYLQEEQCV